MTHASVTTNSITRPRSCGRAAWIVFGLLLGTFTDKTAASPYGSVGLVALFSGFFLMMGFIWSAIGE